MEKKLAQAVNIDNALTFGLVMMCVARLQIYVLDHLRRPLVGVAERLAAGQRFNLLALPTWLSHRATTFEQPLRCDHRIVVRRVMRRWRRWCIQFLLAVVRFRTNAVRLTRYRAFLRRKANRYEERRELWEGGATGCGAVVAGYHQVVVADHNATGVDHVEVGGHCEVAATCTISRRLTEMIIQTETVLKTRYRRTSKSTTSSTVQSASISNNWLLILSIL